MWWIWVLSYTLQRYCTEHRKKIFPERKLRGLSPNFYIHLSVSDLNILRISLPICLQQKTDLGIQKSDLLCSAHISQYLKFIEVDGSIPAFVQLTKDFLNLNKKSIFIIYFLTCKCFLMFHRNLIKKFCFDKKKRRTNLKGDEMFRFWYNLLFSFHFFQAWTPNSWRSL